MQTLVLPALSIPAQTTETPFGKLVVPSVEIPERMIVIEPQVIHAMIVQARLASEQAYHNFPTPAFQVGAACIMQDDEEGRIFTAANCENSVLNAGVCAERALLHYVVAQGFRRLRYLVVTTPARQQDALEQRGPCGLCRQTISEFASDDTLVIIDHQQDGKLGDIMDMNRLLPWRYHYNPAHNI